MKKTKNDSPNAQMMQDTLFGPIFVIAGFHVVYKVIRT